MTINIPQGLFDKYYEAADLFIDNDNIGRSCKVVYPPKAVECSNCTTSMIGASSTSVYKHGGPAPFNFGPCPVCGGNSIAQEESTDTILLRIYWTKKDMARISAYSKISGVSVPDSVVMAIGYMSDIKKIKQAAEILLIDEQTQEEFRFKLESEPYPHGFGKNRYFAVYLKRT